MRSRTTIRSSSHFRLYHPNIPTNPPHSPVAVGNAFCYYCCCCCVSAWHWMISIGVYVCVWERVHVWLKFSIIPDLIGFCWWKKSVISIDGVVGLMLGMENMLWWNWFVCNKNVLNGTWSKFTILKVNEKGKIMETTFYHFLKCLHLKSFWLLIFLLMYK